MMASAFSRLTRLSGVLKDIIPEVAYCGLVSVIPVFEMARNGVFGVELGQRLNEWHREFFRNPNLKREPGQHAHAKGDELPKGDQLLRGYAMYGPAYGMVLREECKKI